MSSTSRPSPRSIQRVYQHKRLAAPETPLLGEAMISFFKQQVTRRETKLAKIAEVWAALIPELLLDHCSLESFSRGSLIVIVDSASHLYELKQLLLAGLQQQLLMACKSTGLRKITLRAGRWYDESGRPVNASPEEEPAKQSAFPKRSRKKKQ